MSPSTSMLDFCVKLGLTREEVLKAETPLNFSLMADVSGERAALLELTDYQTLLDTFGASVSLSVGLPDVAPLLEVVSGHITDLPDAIKSVRARGANLQLSVNLKVDKAILLDHYGLARIDAFCLLYLFTENLVKLLRSPLHELDASLFNQTHKPTFALVLDSSICCSGPFLNISGLDSLDELRSRYSTPGTRLRERVDRYHAPKTSSPVWIDFKLNHLTPLHLLVDTNASEIEGIVSTLRAQSLRLCILYTANRTVRNGSDYIAYFASSERSTPVALRSASIETPDFGRLTQYAIWPYAGDKEDRLVILQNAFARELDTENSEENLLTITEELGRLLDEARWHYRVFVDSEIDKHFEQVQVFARYVVEVTKEVSTNLDVVTKSLVDTLLATIGLIVLTLLAALVDNKTQGGIFTVAMRAYAVYLLVFQVGYRLGSIGHSYRLQKLETQEQIALYSRFLTRQRVEILTAPLERRRKQFIRWFWVTVVIYCVIAVAIWCLAGILPSRLEQAGIWSAPTAAPTTIPVQTTPTASPSLSP